MDYTTSQLSSILFSSQSGSQMVMQLNYALKKLIENDIQLAGTSNQSPKTWECRWLNDSSIDGYSRGDAVWLNVTTPQRVVSQNYEKVLHYISDNAILSQLYADVNKNDIAAVSKFLADVVSGRASDQVSALFFLGDMSQNVQIRVSQKDNNKDYPDASSWKDFYDNTNTVEKNVQLLLDATSQKAASRIAKHIKDCHIDEIQPSQASLWLQSQGFFKRDPFDPDNVKTQKFFDHDYCLLMEGFDYAVSFRHSGSSWCRVWRSGYVEQGGFVENSGESLIEVQLMEDYNYPDGAMFYQRGYAELADGMHTKIQSSMSSSRRYIPVVTPVKKADAQHAYPGAKSYDGEIVHASVDIANMSNSSFSFVNVDTSQSIYSKYSWHVCGYRV